MTEQIAASSRDTLYGLVWDSWINEGSERKTIRKEHGFNSRVLFVRYLRQLWVEKNFDDYVFGWTPEGQLTAEELDSLSVWKGEVVDDTGVAGPSS